MDVKTFQRQQKLFLLFLCHFVLLFLFSMITILAHASISTSSAPTNLSDNNTLDTRTLLERLVSARPEASPSSSVSTPVAFGVGWGNIFFGVVGQNGTQYTTRPFGQYALGFGLGNPDTIGSLTSIITSGGIDEVIRDGNTNFQYSKNFSTLNLAIAIGVENVTPWGADARNKKNLYSVLSQSHTIVIANNYFINIIYSIGLGNSRFVHNYETHTDETKMIRPFASFSLQILPQAALMIDYVGLTYNAGISIVPLIPYPLVLSLTAIDLTNRGGSHIPLAGSLGYSYNFS